MSVHSMYAVGKVRMSASEFHTGNDNSAAVPPPTTKNGAGEIGGFVLWQKNPKLWFFELIMAGCKMSADCNGKLAWRHSTSDQSHVSRGPPRPLRRALQGLEHLAAVDALCDLVAREIGASDLVHTYHVNLSIFTSILDFWVIGQLFPIVPIHRLDQRPVVNGVLSDLTCDSDRKVNKFIDDLHRRKSHQRRGVLHPKARSQPPGPQIPQCIQFRYNPTSLLELSCGHPLENPICLVLLSCTFPHESFSNRKWK